MEITSDATPLQSGLDLARVLAKIGVTRWSDTHPELNRTATPVTWSSIGWGSGIKAPFKALSTLGRLWL